MYLSVKLDHCLSWRPHIDYVRSKENKLLGFLKRNLQSCPKYFRALSCKQFIIEYCAPIWDPYHQSNINKIEMIQHRAAHFVLKKPCRKNYRDSVSSMLADLQWPLLSQRRKCARLTLLHKSLTYCLSHQLISECLPLYFQQDRIIIKNFCTTTR